MENLYCRSRTNIHEGRLYQGEVHKIGDGEVYKVGLSVYTLGRDGHKESCEVKWITDREDAIETAVDFVRGNVNEKAKED